MCADAVMKRCSGAIVMAKRTCEGLREARGADVRSRAALPQSRRSGYTRRKRCAHVSPRRMGGPRMGAVRSRISMTVIGAPQCRQTKVGRASTIASFGGILELGHDVQQFTHLGEIGAAHRVGQQSVVTDPMEAAGQHMEQEAAHELAGVQRHGLVAGAPLCPVVLPAEGDAALIECDQALVGDRHAVRIAREVREHRLRSGKGTLGVDHPLAGAQRIQPPGKGGWIRELHILAEELQLAASVCVCKRLEEAAPEQA